MSTHHRSARLVVAVFGAMLALPTASPRSTTASPARAAARRGPTARFSGIPREAMKHITRRPRTSRRLDAVTHEPATYSSSPPRMGWAASTRHVGARRVGEGVRVRRSVKVTRAAIRLGRARSVVPSSRAASTTSTSRVLPSPRTERVFRSPDCSSFDPRSGGYEQFQASFGQGFQACLPAQTPVLRLGQRAFLAASAPGGRTPESEFSGSRHLGNLLVSCYHDHRDHGVARCRRGNTMLPLGSRPSVSPAAHALLSPAAARSFPRSSVIAFIGACWVLLALRSRRRHHHHECELLEIAFAFRVTPCCAFVLSFAVVMGVVGGFFPRGARRLPGIQALR